MPTIESMIEQVRQMVFSEGLSSVLRTLAGICLETAELRQKQGDTEVAEELRAAYEALIKQAGEWSDL